MNAAVSIIFKFDPKEKTVYIRQGDDTATTIPLSAYEKEYDKFELDTPIEAAIESINYASGWKYSISDNEVLLSVHVFLGGHELPFGIYPKDDEDKEIVPAFKVVFSDEAFSLDYVGGE